MLSEGIYPLFVIDIWEHAYSDYFLNIRGLNEYVGIFFDYLLDWKKINEFYLFSINDYQKKEFEN